MSMRLPGLTVKMIAAPRSAADQQRWFGEEREVLRASWTPSRDGSEVVLDLVVDEVSTRQTVQLVHSPISKGELTSFVCPHTLERCSMLFLDGREFYSAVALGVMNPRAVIDTGVLPARWILDRLAGRDGAGAARGANRQALLEMLPLVRASAAPEDAELIARLTSAPAAFARAKTAAWPADDRYSTQAALAAWPEYVPGLRARDCASILSDDVQAAVAKLRAVPPSIPSRDWVGERRTTNDFPNLDIRVLRKLRHVKSGAIAGFALYWLPPRCDMTAVLASADFRDPKHPFIVVYVRHDGMRYTQVIRLRRDARRRLAFLCPINGTTHEILYWRDDLFASRSAQRLVHASQRKARPLFTAE